VGWDGAAAGNQGEGGRSERKGIRKLVVSSPGKKKF